MHGVPPRPHAARRHPPRHRIPLATALHIALAAVLLMAATAHAIPIKQLKKLVDKADDAAPYADDAASTGARRRTLDAQFQFASTQTLASELKSGHRAFCSASRSRAGISVESAAARVLEVADDLPPSVTVKYLYFDKNGKAASLTLRSGEQTRIYAESDVLESLVRCCPDDLAKLVADGKIALAIARRAPPLFARTIDGQRVIGLQLAPNLIVPVTAEFSALAHQLLTLPIRTSRVHVVAVFDKADDPLIAHAFERLAARSGVKVSFAPRSTNDLRELVKGSRDDTVVLVGHHERGRFIAERRVGAGEPASIGVDEAQSLANNAGADFIALGCRTGARGTVTGPLSPIGDLQIVGQLETALAQSNYLAFLAALASEASPILIDPATASKLSRASTRIATRWATVDLVAPAAAVGLIATFGQASIARAHPTPTRARPAAAGSAAAPLVGIGTGLVLGAGLGLRARRAIIAGVVILAVACTVVAVRQGVPGAIAMIIFAGVPGIVAWLPTSVLRRSLTNSRLKRLAPAHVPPPTTPPQR